MRGTHRPAATHREWTAQDRPSAPRHAYVEPPPPAPVTAIPVTAVVAPVTAIPGADMDWYGPMRWDGWGDSPVPYPRPPEWRGRPQPRPRGWRVARQIGVGAAGVALAAVLGAAGLVAGLKSGAQTPSAQPTTGAQTDVVAPVVPEGGTPAPESSAAAPAKARTLSTAEIVSSVNKSVVNITSTLGLQNGKAAGTGVLLSSDGLVLTNNHVIAGATSISGVAVANGRTFQATVVGFDRSHDIAVIRLANASGLPRLGVISSSSVKVGDPIVAVGNAGGVGGTPTAVTGSVTALNQSITAQEPDGGASQRLSGLIQIAADIRPGDSGGPLVDATGRLIGINTAASADPKDQAAGGKGFAIPSNTAVGIAQQIQDGEASPTIHLGPTAVLGVSVADANGQVAGAAVTGVLSGGPAERAGLTTGDVIRTVDDRAVDSSRALTTIIDTLRPGDEVQVVWVDRAGRSRAATVRLATGPAG